MVKRWRGMTKGEIVRAFREKIEEKTEPALTAKRIIAAARAVQKDDALKLWYGKNVEGRDPSEVMAIIEQGEEKGEITHDQAMKLGQLVGFVSSKGFPTGKRE